MNGWIQFHRQIMEHWVWQDQKQGYRWAELMMLAAWKSETVVYRNCRIEVQRGQLVTSIRALARRWKTNNRVVSSFIKILEGTRMIECDRTNKQWLIITISNYEKFQNVASSNQNPDEFEPNSIGILADSNVGISEKNDKKKSKNEQQGHHSRHHDKKNIINNNNSSSSFAREKNEIYYFDLKNDDQEIAEVARYLKCEKQLVIPMIDDFFIENKDEEHETENAGKFRKHFINWARIHLTINDKDGNEQPEPKPKPKRSSTGARPDENRFSPRRGTDPGSHEAKDFEGKF